MRGGVSRGDRSSLSTLVWACALAVGSPWAMAADDTVAVSPALGTHSEGLCCFSKESVAPGDGASGTPGKGETAGPTAGIFSMEARD